MLEFSPGKPRLMTYSSVRIIACHRKVDGTIRIGLIKDTAMLIALSTACLPITIKLSDRC